ncbi:YARHG domain-containing protein [Marinifilum fragile]|uniref:YARHG domain-containing protein n=1 Tax=Marinifilum fragile TaxID=570161 RepID=UPI002AA80FD1|nr:YARHG domain-containing protein [Marinifilum fragile]
MGQIKIVFIVIVNVFISFEYIYAQSIVSEQELSDIVEIIKPSDQYLKKKTHICSEASKAILRDFIKDEIVIKYNGLLFVPFEEVSTLLVECCYPFDGLTSTYYLISFSCDYQLINKKLISNDHLIVGSKGHYSNFKFLNDSLVELTINKAIPNEEIFEEFDIVEKKYSYFVINKNGFYIVNIDNISEERKFPFSSKRILRSHDLSALNKEEYDIMRNEIFADHGYIFKTKKWKEYFANQSWYVPKYDNVNNELTVVEKINIKNILEASNKK